MKITATTNAFITNDVGVHHFTDALSAGNEARAFDRLVYAPDHMLGFEGWVHVGTAHITVDLLPQDQIQSAQLAALKAKLQEVRAENQQRENAILDAISKLTALEYVEAA